MTSLMQNGFSERAGDEDFSTDFVVVNNDDELLLDQAAEGTISIQAFATQVRDGNAVIIQKLQDENKSLKELLDVKIQEYRKYISDIAEYKVRISKAREQDKEALDALKAENENLRSQLQNASEGCPSCISLKRENEELKNASEIFKTVEDQYKKAIENLRDYIRTSSENADSVAVLESLIGPSMVIVSETEKPENVGATETSTERDETARNHLRESMKLDLEVIAVAKINGAVCIISKDWFDKHAAHVISDFSDDTHPGALDNNHLFGENGQLRPDLKEDVDFTVLSVNCYNKLVEYYDLHVPILDYSLIKRGDANYQLDIPTAASRVVVARDAATQETRTLIMPTMTADNAQLIMEMQQQCQSINDAKMALIYQLDLCKADSDAQRQNYELQLQQLKDTVKDLEKQNTSLVQQLRNNGVGPAPPDSIVVTESMVATGGANGGGLYPCPICTTVFHTQDGVRIHASTCGE